MKGRQSKADLSGTLREIAQLERSDCRQAWITAFKSAPPKYLSIPFMQRMLAHDLQCRALGGHSAASRRALKKILHGGEVPGVARSIADGTTLVREWNGRIYRVEVTPDGYLLDGKIYASLSVIARHITGAHWSGPRFFGLSARRRA
jgi:hypothetical protein